MKKRCLKDNKYIKLNDNQQSILFKKAKKRFRNWNELAKYLNVSKGMIFRYINNQSIIPYCVFKKICSLSKNNEKNFSFEILKPINSQTKEIKLKFNGDLAEIVGITLGDGCIYKELHRNRYQTIISVNRAERDYLFYIKVLFENYFKNYKFYIVESTTELFLKNGSYNIGTNLIKSGLKSGNKVDNKVIIPKWIMQNKVFIIRVIRGLFDTDGCVYKKYDKYAQIVFKFGCFDITNSLRNALKKLKFNPTKIEKGYNKEKNTYFWKFYLSRQEEIKLFFQEIKPKNPKHTKRYLKIKSGDAGI